MSFVSLAAVGILNYAKWRTRVPGVACPKDRLHYGSPQKGAYARRHRGQILGPNPRIRRGTVDLT